MVRSLIERELEEVRAEIRSGRRREWIALLPGMEMEFERVTSDLGTLLGVARAGNGNGHGQVMEMEREQEQEREIESAEAEAGSQVSSQMRQLEAPVEPSPLHGGKSIDVGTLFTKVTMAGRPVLRLFILQELMEKGEINRKEFVERHIGDYPSLKFPSLFTTEVMKLRKKGLNFARSGKTGLTRLQKTHLTGTLPWPDRERAGQHLEPLAMPSKAAASSESSAASEVIFSGNQTDILLQEFEAAPDHVVDILALNKKYKVGSKNAFYWSMSFLKKTRGLKFTNVSRGVFRLEQSRSRKHATA